MYMFIKSPIYIRRYAWINFTFYYSLLYITKRLNWVCTFVLLVLSTRLYHGPPLANSSSVCLCVGPVGYMIHPDIWANRILWIV